MKIHHTTPTLAVTASALLAFGAGASAAPLRLAVDRKGFLRVPAPTLHRMGVKQAGNGLICIQFPLSVLKHPKPVLPKKPAAGMARRESPHEAVPESPPRVWAPLAKDGSLALGKTRLVPGTEYVPGAPGTVYFASGSKGRLVLQMPARK